MRLITALKYGRFMLSHCMTGAMIGCVFDGMVNFRAIRGFCWHSLVSFTRLGGSHFLFRDILHRCHLLEVGGCHLLLLVGLSAGDLLRGDTLERSSLSSQVVGAELGHDVVDGLRVGVLRKALHRSQASVLNVQLVLRATEHALVMHKNFLRQALQYPLVLESLQRGHSVDGVPVQAQVDKVEEFEVGALLEHVLQRLGVR